MAFTGLAALAESVIIFNGNLTSAQTTYHTFCGPGSALCGSTVDIAISFLEHPRSKGKEQLRPPAVSLRKGLVKPGLQKQAGVGSGGAGPR